MKKKKLSWFKNDNVMNKMIEIKLITEWWKYIMLEINIRSMFLKKDLWNWF